MLKIHARGNHLSKTAKIEVRLAIDKQYTVHGSKPLIPNITNNIYGTPYTT